MPDPDPAPDSVLSRWERRRAEGRARAAAGAAEERPPRRRLWPFLLLVAGLCVAGWFLVNWMADSTRIQDCVMSGKKNCAPMDPSLGR